jgi:hypothetical protein
MNSGENIGLWKRFMETVYGNGLWKRFMETVYGNGLWKRFMEWCDGRDLPTQNMFSQGQATVAHTA